MIQYMNFSFVKLLNPDCIVLIKIRPFTLFQKNVSAWSHSVTVGCPSANGKDALKKKKKAFFYLVQKSRYPFILLNLVCEAFCKQVNFMCLVKCSLDIWTRTVLYSTYWKLLLHFSYKLQWEVE